MTIHGNTETTILVSPPQLRVVARFGSRNIEFSNVESVSDIPPGYLVSVTPEGAFEIYDPVYTETGERKVIPRQRGKLNRVYYPGDQLERLSALHKERLEALKKKTP